MRDPAFAIPQLGVGSCAYTGCGRRFNVVCYGNSLTAGNASPGNYPAALAALRPGDTFTNLGTGNQYTDQMLANFAADVVPLASTAKVNVCIWWESVDSINDHGVTPAAEYAKLKSAAALCHANNWLIVVGGAIPCTDPPASPADLATMSTLLRGDHSAFDAFADLHANSVFNVNDAAIYANAGGSPNVHLTDFGYTHPVAAGFNDALNAIVR